MKTSRVAPVLDLVVPQPPLSWEDSFVIDQAGRETIKESFKLPCIYSEDENKYLKAATHMMALFDDKKSLPTTKFETSSSLLSASTCTHIEDGRTITFGLSTCTVRTSMGNIVAFKVNNMSNFETFFGRGASTLGFSTLEVVNPHHSVFYLLSKSPPPFRNRDFVASFVWRKLSANQYICINHPTAHDDAPVSSNVVRAQMARTMRFTEETPGVTIIESIFRLDLMGAIPKFVADTAAIPSSFDSPVQLQRYFT